MSADSEVEIVGHGGLLVAGASHARKIPGQRDGNLRGDDVAFLRRISDSMERSMARTTNQNVRQLEGRRLADMFETIASHQ